MNSEFVSVDGESSFGSVNRYQRYERYLRFLAASQIDQALQGKVDVSGVVQQTLLEAYQNMNELSTLPTPVQLAWLRKSLARNMTDEIRKYRSLKRDGYRERSLEQSMEQSSHHLLDWLASQSEGASKALESEERSLMLAGLILDLPEAQRNALMLHYWHRLSLIDIGLQLNRSPSAVAGLLKRALASLRNSMKNM